MTTTPKNTKGPWLTSKEKCKIIEGHNRCPSLTLSQLAHWAERAGNK
ncbi:hypothetical protein PC116_g26820 [Phytophthora cactorum]|uniref:Uncharacterized protein n=1 Tax=Phytophthora cactorum TaxID=29920 RepID=A0A8T1JHX2_9STRA|nr:hypothetical protein PC112_g22573 [Phytophthora cactorum]KAG2821575.1 hypothetical protein PC113_g22453 [Phytophthora cactorum]KAG2881735.1 hypothetical protein PC117_g26341 [Phytophthora cactorum]KAG2958017.1 hypothetical protein PC118_g23733 [Phytophthora cactorum]KAG2961259.1 hypothetical protein PC119_g26158 [Phytophthora cactorum]